jgi:hypothetical protein
MTEEMMSHADGRREVLGMDIVPPRQRTAFLRKLARRGLRGVKLVISDAHDGIKASVSKVLRATWLRCRVHFMRNVLAPAGKSGKRVVSAFIGTAFAQDSADAVKTQWRKVADQLRPKLPKLAVLRFGDHHLRAVRRQQRLCGDGGRDHDAHGCGARQHGGCVEEHAELRWIIAA